jgi:sporulation-control protein
MVFKKLLGALGVGGPRVDTVLAGSQARPGEIISGEVHIQGGDHPVEISQVILTLVGSVTVEHAGGTETPGEREFGEVTVGGGFSLAAGQQYSLPFQMQIPWEIAITELYGRSLPGVAVGVRTHLKVAKALGTGDMDPVQIHPLPSQQRVLDALGHLGFLVRGSVVENGQIPGVMQRLPFHQEIDFQPPPAYQGVFTEVSMAIVTSQAGLSVALETEGRGGFLRPVEDTFGRFDASHEQATMINWEQQFTAWLQAAVARRQAAYGPGGPGYGQPGMGYGRPGMGAPGQRRGPGWGGVAAAAAGGVVAGMVAGEAIDLAGDAIEGTADLVGDGVEGAADLVGDGFEAVGDGFEDVADDIGDLF